ncbi:cysteine-rich motor neuron 1 protein-like isoform X2 [Venturia canescens]|uniref:cysteine-rich motor neuron 1 protein-like isoform X2 n=1 Tax=Venturia canescens TaxID=32260 RepID=UPI001C9CE41F|nr:cysteine-rich motor neuron 1 protein-like isoform X2 [Venturia canescens]
MRVPLVLLSGIVVLSVAVARALSCVCSPLECDVLTEDDCPGGLTWDPCQCCKVCARVEGEPCGGLFGFSGSCAPGLQCVIKNLLHHTKEVDEGTCSKIPGRWRRHCPQGLKMSSPGCNLIGEGMTNYPEKVKSAGGKCSCGPAVLWCPSEPRPYTYQTRHECILNLVAKLTYDQKFTAPDPPTSDNGVHSTRCPPDSILTEDGACECVSVCPTHKCGPGERPLEVRAAAVPVTPGSCCPLYNCVPSETISWDENDDSQLRKKCVDDFGIPRPSGEEWQQGPCVNCTCETGVISCHATMCKSCENPAPLLPGECCPRCLTPTNETTAPPNNCPSLDDCQLPCGQFDNGVDECPSCKCPKTKCLPLHQCGSNCMVVKDDDGCDACACNKDEQPDGPSSHNGAVTSEDSGVVCPELKCDLHCERGLVMDENDCTLCQCKPQAGCPSMAGCKKKCPYGYKTNRRGCPVCRCRATCTDLHNTTHPEGTSWEPDVCTACFCDYVGRLVCKETVCSVACSNPLPAPPGSCCPICPTKHPDRNGTVQHIPRGWGTVPIILISTLALICIMLIFYVLRGRFRGRLSQKASLYSTYPTQYYKCVPAYEMPNHRNEKVVPL